MNGIMRRVLTAVCIFLTLAVSFWAFFLDNGQGAIPASKTQDVKVARAEKQKIDSVVTASGVVEEVVHSDVYAPQVLRVTRLYAGKGDRVKAGDKLLEYDASQLESQYEQLLLSRQIQVETLEKIRSTDSTRNTAQLEAAVSQAVDAVNTAWSAYDRLRKEYDDLKILYEKHRLSQKDLDKANSALKTASEAVKNSEYAYESARANLDDLVRMNGQAADGRDAELEIQENSLKMLDFKIKDAEKAIDDIVRGEKSPIDGVISQVNVEEGGFAAIQAPVLRVVDDGRLQIRANIKEYDADTVKPGQKAEITCDTFADGTVLSGTVREVSRLAGKTLSISGGETVVEAVISTDKPSKLLMPGLNTTCRITAASRSDAVVISYVAIKDNLDGSKSVFVVNGQGRLESRKVKLGISSDTNVEVLDGLKEGDLVVTNWQPAFNPGDRARIMK